MNASPVSDARPDERPRVLVVDDEFLVRTLIATALRELGVDVDEAASADEAWIFLCAGYRVDLVFTDHRMPGSMTGAQLATRIRAEHPAVDVVLVSADWQGGDWPEPVVAKPYALIETAAELAKRALGARRKET